MEQQEAMRLARSVRDQVMRTIVGQETVIEQALVGLLAGGHLLLEGPPGTAKTLLVRSLALATQARFGRVQFTPDLMPADITGVSIYHTPSGEFRFRPGPVFCDMLLADEINRAPAKTQSALLEAMQENQVTVDGQRHELSPSFIVFATQNPIEYEGTYPLPEAQVDRFMMKLLIDYPAETHEQDMVARHQEGFDARRPETFNIEPILSVQQLQQIRESAGRIHVDRTVLNYITSIVRATRGHHLLMLGASPRAAVMLLAAAKAVAVLRDRAYVVPDDVRDMAKPTLRHRLVLRPEAEIEGATTDQCVEDVLKTVEVPRIDHAAEPDAAGAGE